MLTKKTIREIQADKPTLTEKFISKFDKDWEMTVRQIKRKVIWVKKDE